jgi:DNA mismatch repair ATPase MutS
LSITITHSLSEIFLLTDALLRDVLLDLVADLGAVYKLREITSTLDVLCSFAEVAAEADTGTYV